MSLIYLGACIETLARNPLAESLRFCNYDELNSLKVSHDEFPLLLDSMKSLGFIQELSLISTCNRFEIYCFSDKALTLEQIIDIKEAIRSVNKSSVELSVLYDADAELHFLRTYCGTNSSLIGEDEICLQINISFRQSITMGYLGEQGLALLQKAMNVRKFFDTEIYSGKVSYCGISIQKAIEKLEINSTNKFTLLGSGSTAYQALLSLVNSGVSAENIQLLHRISSSSNQIAMFKKNPLFEKLRYSRTKYGYHTQKAKDLVYHSDVVVFAIDSKNPVIFFPKDSKIKIIDFNSKPSCAFEKDMVMDKYLSGQELDEFVRDYSKQLLQNPSFEAKIELGHRYLQESVTSLESTPTKQHLVFNK